jgi:hypothetical protein
VNYVNRGRPTIIIELAQLHLPNRLKAIDLPRGKHSRWHLDGPCRKQKVGTNDEKDCLLRCTYI